MNELESGSNLSGPSLTAWPETIRAVTWNINRGLQLDRVIDFLASSCADLILLQETDVNARRTEHRNVPREIAQALRMNYIFGREFEELAQGSPTNPAHHGQTTLSRLPLSNARILRFLEQSTFWQPRWYIPPLPSLQRRRGGRMALICEISIKGKIVVVYNAHLESRGNAQIRMGQLSEILADIQQYPAASPVVVVGDFNFDLSCGPASSLIARSGLTNPFASFAGLSTVLKSRNGKPSAIDWMLTRGALTAHHAELYKSVAASDHFPLSLDLRLK
jgi:endonuclease/exonuclease/phosphatase family metal-dependent hydrolase